MNSLLKKIIVVLFTLAGLGVLAYFISIIGPGKIIAAITRIKSWQALVIFLFAPAVYFIAVWRIKFILNSLGQKISSWKLFKIYSTGSAASLILPTYGLSGVVATVFLLEKEGAAKVESAAAAALDQFIRLLVNFFMTFALMAYMIIRGFRSKEDLILLWTLAFILFLSVLLLNVLRRGGKLTALFKRFMPKELKLEEQVESLDNIISDFFSKQKKYFWAAVAVSFIGFCWEIVQLVLILIFLNVVPNLTQSLGMYLGLALPRVFPVPGDAGFVEGGAAVAGSLLFGNAALGVSTAILLRIRDLGAVFIGFLFWLPYSRRFL